MISLPSTASVPNSSLALAAGRNQTCSMDDEALRVPLAVLYSLLFLFGSLGNGLALWVFLFLHSRRNSVRVFLINVALADLVLLACLPFRVLYHAAGNRWLLGGRACKLVGNAFYMNMYVSITLLGLISLDRYVKLQGAGRGWCGRRLRGSGWSVAACAVLWLGSLAALVPAVALAEVNEEPGKCFQYRQRARGHGRGMARLNLALVAAFWAVFAVLALSYGRIALWLLRASRAQPGLPNAARYARTARKSFVVLALFAVCFAPYHAFRGVYVWTQLSEGVPCWRARLVDRTNEVVLLLSVLNSCLDPVMYFVLSGSVRKAALRALAAVLCRRDEPAAAATTSSTTEFRRTSETQVAGGSAPRGSISLAAAQRCLV